MSCLSASVVPCSCHSRRRTRRNCSGKNVKEFEPLSCKQFGCPVNPERMPSKLKSCTHADSCFLQPVTCMLILVCLFVVRALVWPFVFMFVCCFLKWVPVGDVGRHPCPGRATTNRRGLFKIQVSIFGVVLDVTHEVINPTQL